MKAGASGPGPVGPAAHVYEQRYYTPFDVGVDNLYVPNGAGVILADRPFFLEGQVDVTVQASDALFGDGSGGLTLYMLVANENDVLPPVTDIIQVLSTGSFCGPAGTWAANTFSTARGLCGVVRRCQFVLTNDFPAADDALVSIKLLTRGRAVTPGLKVAA